ncbi:hypothetical protein H1164_12440 [Thermoactinomyces daqus]|uniref:Uncharacterized protein n=1 Tax=Thermoactinomyces daqus TaxID=1329516 RepID=A0A7W1XBV7_9BACL|nr:hypothetical protein [Thermoactinomyces daqus]
MLSQWPPINWQNSVSYNGTQVYSFQYNANNNLTKETDETAGTSTNYNMTTTIA